MVDPSTIQAMVLSNIATGSVSSVSIEEILTFAEAVESSGKFRKWATSRRQSEFLLSLKYGT